MLFQHSTAQRTQTVTAAVMCPEYPVRVYMEAPVLLAMDEHRGVVGQYYGYDMKMQDMGDEDTRDYRRSVFGMIDLISTDSLGIVLGQHLEAPVSELNLSGDVVESDLNITFHGGTIVYQNGTAIQIGTNNNLAQAEIYRASITNIMLAVQHAVELDLGDPGPNNIFINAAAVNNAFNPNVAPVQVDPGLWMGNHSSYAYGYVVPPYQTWAQMIRAGLPQELPIGNLTGRPWDSKMLTNYLCPFYKLKPTGALLSGVFIGTATMILSVWAAWMTLSAIIAKRALGVSYRETHVEGNRNSTVSGTEKGGPAVENHIEELPKSGAATGTAKAIRTVFCL
ncbi:hypothetical protein OPQ81_005598 [Rhizoctonia solani]|nr:hypothetical protein OPQ81_005598 [Rhizoctonia solani]